MTKDSKDKKKHKHKEKEQEKDLESGAAEEDKGEEISPAAAPASSTAGQDAPGESSREAGVHEAPTPYPPIGSLPLPVAGTGGVVLVEAVPYHEHIWGPPVPDPIAWALCILTFPFGIIFLFLCTQRYCQICGAVLYDWPW